MSTGAALLHRRLLIVTGKGGVGKSTVAAALALRAAREGRRVLVCELNTASRVAPLLGAPPTDGTMREARPGLSTLVVTPRDAMREYGVMVLRFRPVYQAVFENRLARYFLRAIPSLSELVMLGKVLHEVRSQELGRPRWDLVVLDAPSTGHAVQLLRVPAVLLDTVPPGPLRKDAQWMQAMLVDPACTALVLVTLPEETPVNEAIELDATVRTVLRMPRGALMVNAMPEARFAPQERARLAELAHGPPPLGPAAAAARLQGIRAAQARAHLGRARAAIDLPTLTVPLLHFAPWGPQAVEAVAASLGEEGAWAPSETH